MTPTLPCAVRSVSRLLVLGGAVCAVAGPASAAPDVPSWAVVDGNKRLEFVTADLQPAPTLEPGQSCHAWLEVEPDAIRALRVPEDADRRLPRTCDETVLAAVQPMVATWRITVMSFAPVKSAALPVHFVVEAQGEIYAELEPGQYGVSATAHPASLRLIERPALERAPNARYPGFARKLVKQGALAPVVSCVATLDLGADGDVTAVALADCPEALRDVAADRSRDFRFSPRKVNGVPEPTALTVSVVLSAE